MKDSLTKISFILAALLASGITACSEGDIISDNNKTCDECGEGSCCGGVCVDTASDRKNCGACGKKCGSGEYCVDSKCTDDPECAPKTCSELNSECGYTDDGCGGKLKCGSCDDGDVCAHNKCVPEGSCIAKTCIERGAECGSIDDGCEGTLNCGSCYSSEVCSNNQCIPAEGCKHKTCEDLGATCGSVDDGCGTTLDCGSCKENQACADNQCVAADPDCTPKTCEDLSAKCGSLDNGCGTSLNCGECSENQTCKKNQCVATTPDCTPKTCEDLGAKCGSLDNGCGTSLKCGECAENQTCKKNKCVDNEPACNAKTCKDLGAACGSIDDGCGKKIDCGTCAENQSCKSNKCVDNECKPTNSCFSKQYWCGKIDDGCGKKIDCGSCTDGQECKSGKCTATDTSYPVRKNLKGIQPDGVDTNQIIGNAGGGVAINLVWQHWQPSQKGSCGGGEVLYDGNCFTINSGTASEIKKYSDAGLVVTGILWGAPQWAASSCNTGVALNYMFCAPKNGKDFGRFAGFLANYFNGMNGHGRVADFVIHNEVSDAGYFNWGQGANPSYDTWTSKYAESYIPAYDAIKKEQPHAKVLMSFDHFFGNDIYYNLVHTEQRIAVKTFIKTIVPKLGDREWRVAFHSYPPNLLETSFGANDYNNNGVVSFGNIGVLAGWLRQNYPNDPHAWEIQLTENGINGTSGRQSAQKTQLCQAFRNVIGTPGVESFIYHRLVDHPDETSQGLALGLWDVNSNPKPAWETWALANRDNPTCGFETLPYITLRRGKSSSGKHWITTRQFPSGYSEEKTWKILRDKFADTELIFECRVGGSSGDHTLPSTDINCENQFNMGPLGYVYKTKVEGSVAIYRCYNESTGDHFVSGDSQCEGSKKESRIGYVMP